MFLEELEEQMYKKQLAVVIPTRNERDSITYVVKTLIDSIKDLESKIIIVDDGDDDIEQILSSLNLDNLIFLRRTREQRDGLSGAVIKGFSLAQDCQYIAVMDGDGQHPSENIRKMYELILKNNHQMVVATRYKRGGSLSGLDGVFRKMFSQSMRLLPIIIFPKIKQISDPLSGCFLVNNSNLKINRLEAIGWKIALEIALFSDIHDFGEISYSFKERIGGKSKAKIKTGLEYFLQLVSLSFRYYFQKGEIE